MSFYLKCAIFWEGESEDFVSFSSGISQKVWYSALKCAPLRTTFFIVFWWQVETEDLAPDAGNDTKDEEAEEVPIGGEVNPDNEEADVAPAADPDPPAAVPPAPVPAPGDQPQGLGAAHQAMLQGGGPTGFQPYKHPKFFHASVSKKNSCSLKLALD